MEIKVPDLGDFDEVEIIEVLVKPGDKVSVDDPLVTLETEKAAMDVPSTAAGEVGEVRVSAGDRVSEGTVLVVLANGDDAAAAGEDKDDRESNDDRDAKDGKARKDSKDSKDSSARHESDDADDERSDTEGAGRGQAASGDTVPVVVPDMGDFDSVEVIDVLVAEGDTVDAEQGLITVETEKAAMDVPAPAAGRVSKLHVSTGDRVSAGDTIAELEATDAGDTRVKAKRGADEDRDETEAEDDADRNDRAADDTGRKDARQARSKAPEASDKRDPGRLRPVDEAGFSKAHASPSVRKLARELGVDLGRVRGSGRKGRVTADDVKGWVRDLVRDRGREAASGLPELPKVDFSRFGEVRREKLSRVQKIAGPRLHASWVNIPHVTQHEEVDITAMEEARQRLKPRTEEKGIKLTPLAFIMRACVLTLQELSQFNVSLDPDGEHIVHKQYLHMGFAVDTPGGLVVPVIRDADQKDVFEIAEQLAKLSRRAREARLTAADMQGGCFTISSLGGIGGTAFTPIINPPEVAILGVSRHRMQPIWNADEERFVPRLMLPVSLSYDHRVIDGADAARFVTTLGRFLGHTEKLLEAIP